MPNIPQTTNIRDAYSDDDCREPALIVWVLFCAAVALVTGLLIAVDPLGLL